MKKTITAASLILVTFFGTTAFIINKSSTGYAGYTNSPGESYCGTAGCHGGGSSATSTIVVTSVPQFTNDEYVPGTTYTISVQANAAGFTRYGFGCEILTDGNTNAGTMQSPGSGVKFLNAGARRNAVHSTTKLASSGTATFTFQWVAPAEGTGNATFYVAANAVNGNASTSGDFPITPISYVVTEGAVPTTTFTGVRENSAELTNNLSVFPNPANGITTISYDLKQNAAVSVELTDMTGKTVKSLLSETQPAGAHSHVLNLQSVPAGVYFIKTSVNNKKASQKLITVL